MKYKLIFCFVFSLFYTCNINIQAQNKDYEQQKLSRQLDSSYNLIIRAEYYDAIQISKNVLSSPFINDDIAAYGHSILGIAFTEINPKDGLEYFFKAKAYYEKQMLTQELISLYNNIGTNYMLQDSIDKSSHYYKKALLLSNDYVTNYNLLYPTYNLANNIIKYGEDFKIALEYLNIALKHTDPEDYYVLGEVYKNLGHVYLKLENYNESLKYFNKAIPILQKNNYLQGLKEVYSLKSQLYGSQSNYKDAYKTLQFYVAINDSINNQTNDAISQKVETDFTLKKKEQELQFVKKQKETENKLLKRTKFFNIGLIVFIALLLLISYLLYKKNKQYKEAKEAAEKLSKVKSDFYSEVSHELRTPLYAVIELSGLLLRENTESIKKEYIKSLNFSAKHLLALINNVLQLNKVGFKKMTLNNSIFNLKALTDGVLDSLEYALSESKNNISLNYDASIPEELKGDALKISQIFINLISNSIKYTNEGEITITIRKEKETSQSLDLYFEIKDTGEGISKESQKYIFDDFYQDNSNINKSYKGSGLGLSIVKRTLNVMGSEINLKSKLGEGSIFSFTIVLEKPTQTILKDTTKESYINHIKNYKFLIVDDNKVNQIVTKKLLEQFNLESEIVSSGQEAIDILKSKHFDCILMDLHMPQMTGYEATDHIREFNKDVTIIALTAASQEEVDEKIAKHDMQDYIMKPFITDVFIRKIAQAIKTKSS